MQSPNRPLLGKWILTLTVSIGALLCLAAIVVSLMSSSASTPAASRIFREMKLSFIGEYRLPQIMYNKTPVGGLSGITYDRVRDVFYAVSDDRSSYAPARFYTLKLVAEKRPNNLPKFIDMRVIGMTTIRDKNGNPYPLGAIDCEGISLTSRGTIVISSEGDRGAVVKNTSINPFVGEFNLQTGKLIQYLTIPTRYLPDIEKQRGIQNNMGFESLSVAPAPEPINLFTATEANLVQDLTPPIPNENIVPRPLRVRWLHYILDGAPRILGEYFYELNLPPLGAIEQGLSDILSIDNTGRFITMERSLGLTGFKIELFQASMAGASDTKAIESLNYRSIPTSVPRRVQPIHKLPLLNLSTLQIRLDNLEGMTFGPQLPDGRQTLLLVSDNNFRPDDQITQFLWLAIDSK
jgi:hypothetical protein